MAAGLDQLLLVAMPLVPALGAVVAGVVPATRGPAIRAIGWTFSIAALAIWLALRSSLSGDAGLLVEVRAPWVPVMGISLHLGLDGLGFMMAGLISFVGVAGAVGTLPRQERGDRSHIVCLLLAEAGMLGAVAAWDLILFIACWELTLVAFFFLLGRGPGGRGVAAATRFMVASITSSVLMWVAVLWLVRLAGSPPTFDLADLPQRLTDIELPALMVWMMAAGFLVRMAALPLHTWFPAAASEVPTAAGILLAGGVLPLGGFGLVHVAGRLFGPTMAGQAEWFVWLGLVTCLGGGLASLVQRDLKRLLAFVCLAQLGLALAGLSAPAALSRQGGMIMLVAAGLGGTCLFLFAGVICWARGSQRLIDIGGLWRAQPMFAGLAFAGVASAAAVPATAGFVGVYRLLAGLAGDGGPAGLPAAAMVAGGVLVIGSSVLWAYRRVLGGSYQSEVWTRRRWPRRRQVGIMLLLAVVILAAGLFPGLVTPSRGRDSAAAWMPEAGALASGPAGAAAGGSGRRRGGP